MSADIIEAFKGCGEILNGINVWYDGALKELQDLLDYRGKIQPKFKPFIDRDNTTGTLKRHLSDVILSDSGKYRISVYLVLYDNYGNSENCPYVAWQFAGTNQPKMRILEIYEFDEFPHRDPDGWEIVKTEECPESVIFKYRDRDKNAKVRNCHFYTSIMPLLNDKPNFFNVLIQLVDAIQSESFQAKVYVKKLSKYLIDIPIKDIERNKQ